MKAMFIGFIAIVALTLGANYALTEFWGSSADRQAGEAVRLGKPTDG